MDAGISQNLSHGRLTYRRMCSCLSPPVWIFTPESKESTGKISTDIFFHVPSSRRAVTQTGKWPIQQFKGWVGCMMLYSHFNKKKRKQGIFQVPFSSHCMDSVGIWQINSVKLALASQCHPSAQASVGLHQLLRNFMKAAYYKSMAVIKSK